MTSVKEGFICPMCMEDLGDVLQLEVHFQEKHNSSNKSTEVISVHNIKDLIKKKVDGIRVLNPLLQKAPWIMSNDSGNVSEELNVHPVTGISYEEWPESYDTIKEDFYSEFTRLRSKRNDRFSTDTNKLIIRLEKLMTNLPTDPIKRRNHEKNIVPWMDEESVKRCPDCSKSFGVTRRKHHCRLCGSILCTECSHSISFELAKRLINPATISDYSIPLTEENDSSGKGMKKYGSRESLSSLFSSPESAKGSFSNFRSCKYCADIINKRDSQVKGDSGEPPMIVQYYDHLKDLMKEAEEMSKLYTRMVQSLRSGETDYRLEDAKFVRVKIMKMAENIDAISKRILTNGPLEGQNGRSAQTLQANVRSLALMFIKEHLVCLEDVPSESEFNELKRKRLEETSRRVEGEKTSARIAQEKHGQKQSLSADEQRRGHLKMDEGFVLSPNSKYVNLPSSDDDPILQQIQIIEGYIAAAKNANRFDEVHTLVKHLKDLKVEYGKKAAERRELEENYNSYKHIFKASPSSHETPEVPENGAVSTNPFDEN